MKLNILNICFKALNKLIVGYVFKTGCWNNFQKSCLVLTTDSVYRIFFTHMEHKCIFLSFPDYNSFIHEQALDVINNLCWEKDDLVTALYDNEWYLDVVVEVGEILAYITDELTCF